MLPVSFILHFDYTPYCFSGILPFVAFPASPLLGFIGDKIGYKIIYISLLLLNALVAVAFTLIPPYESNIQHKIEVTSVDDIKNNISEVDDYILTFSEFSNNCSDKFNVTISKLVCEDETFEIDYELYADNFFNDSLLTCNDLSVCRYTFSSNFSNSSIFCDAYIKDSENERTSGNFAMLFWLYLTCKISWMYVCGPAWNFIEAASSKICPKVGIDWAWFNVAGNFGSIVAPIIAGQLIKNLKVSEIKIDCLTNIVIDEMDYRLPYYCCAASLVLTALVGLLLRMDIQPVRTEVSWWKEMSWLWTMPALGKDF